MEPTPPVLRYRPDIDGMRSLAVLVVVLYHAGVERLSGGFVGVDVFFVLTGFLITSLLLGELDAGRFSLKRFYLRRIKRILPALTLVLVVTIGIGFWLLWPTDLLALLNSARFALLSVSNFYFWRNTGGYFDAAIDELPLLHTWSLGVEEQFYLLWPCLLWLGHRFASRRMLTAAVALLCILGLGVSQWAALQQPSAAYYLLHGRAFEILLGALAALTVERAESLPGLLRDAGSVVGLAMVLAAALLLGPRSTFPGLNALWPCLGTVLLLYSGAGTGRLGVVNRLLSLQPFVGLGLLSYSIYLWHWPLLAYLNYRGIRLVGLTQALAVVAPICVSAVTYVLVERPLRHSAWLSLRVAFALFVVLPVAAGFAVCDWAEARAGLPERFPAAELDEESATAAAEGCRYNRDLSLVGKCTIGVDSATSDGLLIGDSYAGMYVRFLDVLAKDARLSLRHRWFRRSPPIPGVSSSEQWDRAQIRYSTGRQRLLVPGQIGVLGSSWGGYRHEGATLRLWNEDGRDVSAEGDELELAALEELVVRGVKLVLLDRPRAPPGRELMKKVRAAVSRGESLDRFRVPIVGRPSDYVIDVLRKKYPQIVVIRPDDPVCDEQTCAVALRGKPLYRSDGSHLTHEAARLLGETYLRKYPNPLKALRPSGR